MKTTTILNSLNEFRLNFFQENFLSSFLKIHANFTQSLRMKATLLLLFLIQTHEMVNSTNVPDNKMENQTGNADCFFSSDGAF